MTENVVAPAFLPWLRTGLAAHIAEAAVEGLAPHDSTTVAVTVALRSTGSAGERVDPITGPPVRLRGPADVVGVEATQILRMRPQPDVYDAEANYFALIEFDAPDLPWRFTPAAAAEHRLQPWLALVVVEDRRGISLVNNVLHVDDGDRELPDLTQCWAWAHVHADHDLADGVATALSQAPQAFRSRLLCPRRLGPDRAWIACVVPTFEAGRRAGLGLTVGADLGLAWQPGAGDVELPVYHSWRFRTRAGGDFESLVRRLRPRELPGSVGRRDLDISDPGNGLPTAPGTVVSYSGGLLSPAGVDREWPEESRTALKAGLRDLLNDELARSAPGRRYDALHDDPVVGPPAYAARQADTRAVPDEGTAPVWFEQLNTEPPHRVAAAMGARVVRKDQESLMAAAWRFAGDAQGVRQVLTRGRFAWEAAIKAQPRFVRLSDASLVQVAGPALARLTDPSGLTVRGALAAGGVPDGLLSGAFRRLTRTAPGAVSTQTVTAAALAEPLVFSAAWTSVHIANGADVQASTQPAAAASERHRSVGRAAVPARRARLSSTATPAGTAIPAGVPAPSTGASAAAGTVRGALDSAGTVVSMVNAVLTGIDATTTVPARHFVRPQFTTAMYERLVALSVDFLVPGIGVTPDNTLGLLTANQPFVEAFLAGFNYEIGREFLWREFPARPGGTWSQRFWSSALPDITAIGAWSGTAALGGHRPDSTPAVDLVLLVKGQLPKLYPDMRVYAVEAAWDNGKRREAPEGDVRMPVFSGRLGADATFYGFTLTTAQAIGGTKASAHPGYFFVLEEHPSGARFGLDAPADRFRGTAPRRWSGLSWSHLAGEDDQLPDFVDVTGPPWLAGAGALGGNGGHDMWGDDAAAMARITLQRPVRMLTHASAMLPPSAASEGPLGLPGGPLPGGGLPGGGLPGTSHGHGQPLEPRDVPSADTLRRDRERP